MNMPVLPVTSSSPPPAADASARGADAAASTDAPAFSNVLSRQRDGAAPPPETQSAETRRPAGKAGERAPADPAGQHDPLGPDETLSLILDSAALPLMQAAAATLENRAADAGAATRPAGAAEAHALRMPADIRAEPATDTRGGARDGRQADPAADTGSRLRAPGIEAAALLPAARARAAADEPAPAPIRDAGRARIAATQPHIQPANQAFDAQAAGRQAADPAVQVSFSASGADATQLAAPNVAQASAAAPAAASLLPAGTPAPAAAPVVAVPTPLSNPQWPQDFSRQVLQLTQSLAGAGHTVQMHVNPPELGPIHITLHVGDSITQASFVSPHASVRQALENALPHLEQQLAQAGLSLGQADVGDQQPGQQTQGQGSSARNGESTFSLDGQLGDTASLPTASPTPRTIARPDALVDTFA